MLYSINIYGRADSKNPDIIYTFTIGEHLHDGKWHHSVMEKKYEFKNELIEELSEEVVISEIKAKIEEILNSVYARNLLICPVLRLYYDDELKKPIVTFSDV